MRFGTGRSHRGGWSWISFGIVGLIVYSAWIWLTLMLLVYVWLFLFSLMFPVFLWEAGDTVLTALVPQYRQRRSRRPLEAPDRILRSLGRIGSRASRWTFHR